MKTDNEIIAEFMGYHCINPLSGLWVRPGMSASRGLCFESNWNELMPVVEKIDQSERFYVDLRTTATFIRDKDDSIIAMHDMGTYTRLQHTYKAVVEFIKWYNNQSLSRQEFIDKSEHHSEENESDNSAP